jgi:hypothetical protein
LKRSASCFVIRVNVREKQPAFEVRSWTVAPPAPEARAGAIPVGGGRLVLV